MGAGAAVKGWCGGQRLVRRSRAGAVGDWFGGQGLVRWGLQATVQAALASLPAEAIARAYPVGTPGRQEHVQWGVDAQVTAVFEILISGTLGCLMVRWLSPKLLPQVASAPARSPPSAPPAVLPGSTAVSDECADDSRNLGPSMSAMRSTSHHNSSRRDCTGCPAPLENAPSATEGHPWQASNRSRKRGGHRGPETAVVGGVRAAEHTLSLLQSGLSVSLSVRHAAAIRPVCQPCCCRLHPPPCSDCCVSAGCLGIVESR